MVETHGLRMPALFVGHGSPMNAIEDNVFSRGWADAARRLPAPAAVLCVSAHWETAGVRVTSSRSPETIHDFYGFPRALFDVRYPAPGDPSLARRLARLARIVAIGLDDERGLDHGCWSVLRAMYPRADVPTVQLSLDTSRPAAFHYALAGELAALRDEGVLIIGSGDIVHNLGVLDWKREGGYDWAVRFNDEVRRRILTREHAPLVAYPDLGPDARLAVPTPEHYLPLLYVLALQEDRDEVAFFNDAIVMGSVSMTSLTISRSGRWPDRDASR
jgi:4,5-DOPA dioxygenase extradiol